MRRKKGIFIAIFIVLLIILLLFGAYKNLSTTDPSQPQAMDTLTDSEGNVYLPILEIAKMLDYDISKNEIDDKESGLTIIMYNFTSPEGVETEIITSINETGAIISLECNIDDEAKIITTMPFLYDDRLFFIESFYDEMWEVAPIISDI